MPRLLLPLILFFALAATARADEWTPVRQSCSSALAGKGCVVEGALGGARDVAVSPDGRSAYVVGTLSDSLLTFDRDPATGALTRRGCLSPTQPACVIAGPLDQPSDVEVSPDGRQVYVAVLGGVTMFDRAGDGTLSHQLGAAGCVQRRAAPGLCAPVDGIDAGFAGAPVSLRFSPDGRSLYAGTGNGAIVALKRDLATGVLSAGGCVRDDGAAPCFDSVGLGSGRIDQVAVSPDGRFVFAPATTSRGVVVLDGSLAQRPGACLTASGDGGACAKDARFGTGTVPAVELSPDGGSLYVAADDRVVVLARDGGSVAVTSCVQHAGKDGCTAGVRNMLDLSMLAFSGDGEDLVAVSANASGGLTFLARGADGRLTQAAGVDGCVTPSGGSFDAGDNRAGACRADEAVAGNGRAAFVNGNQFYAGFQLGSSVVAFKRDYPPRCADQSLSVAQDTALAVGFACADRNGDALGFSVVGAPTAGQLGAIDTAGARVFYNPFGGFAGADSFRYRAVAGGRPSNVATASVTVVASAPAGGAPPAAAGAGGLDADRDGFFAGQDCNDASAAIRPGALEVRGNRVDENCDGLAEPFPTVTSGVSAKWAIDGARFRLTQLVVSNPPRSARLELRCTGRGCPLRTRKLSGTVRRGLLDARPSLGSRVRYRAGQTIEVRIAATGFNTKVARIKLRAGKTPSVVPLCLPPGSSRPQKTCT